MKLLGIYLVDVIAMKFILILLSFNLEAEIQMQTLDSFEIQSLDADALVVSKVSESTDSHLSFLMSRPFCICNDLTFAILNTDTEIKEGDSLQGKMVIDLRAKPVTFSVEHKTDTLLLLTVQSFPSIRESSVIEIKTNFIEESYLTKGLKNVMEQSKKICESFIEYEQAEPKEIHLNLTSVVGLG
ncbi:MAG: hypothetical protein ACJ0F4_00325 [Gammaproteobacteria bacterium]